MIDDNAIDEIEILAKIVFWEWSAASNELSLSDSFRQIFSLPGNFVFKYRAFLRHVFDDDRAYVHSIFSGLPDMHFFPQFYLSIFHEGETRHLFVKGQAIANAAGTVTAVRGIVQDVTESRNALFQIESQNERFKEITWMQSHVLRAPVATIMGLLDLLDQDTLSEEQQHIISGLRDTALTLDTIVREISSKSEAI